MAKARIPHEVFIFAKDQGLLTYQRDALSPPLIRALLLLPPQ